MRIQWRRALAFALVMMLAVGPSAAAFDDVPADGSGSVILELREKGIVLGDGKSFAGERALTLAEGLAMIVRGFELQAGPDEPADLSAGDPADPEAEGAWYAEAFRIAEQAGLDVPRDADPAQAMTREAYLHLLCQALQQTGDYPFTMRYFAIADEDEIDPAYGHSLQLMLNGGFVQLDGEGRLHPKEAIARREAAVTLHAVLAFAERVNEARAVDVPADGEAGQAGEGEALLAEEVTFTVEPVNDEAVKVVLSRGEKPNSGYGLEIEAIVFRGETAEIRYRLHDPEPGRMYLQVMTTPTATAFLPAGYEVVLKQAELKQTD